MKCSRRDLGFLLPALVAAGVTRLDAQQPPPRRRPPTTPLRSCRS